MHVSQTIQYIKLTIFINRFFTPTIEEMKKKSNLFLLVLTNGGYDGLGKERTEEMAAASKYMGFTNHIVLNDKRIPDGPR